MRATHAFGEEYHFLIKEVRWNTEQKHPVSGNQKRATLKEIIMYFPICPKECRKRKGQRLSTGAAWINIANNRHLISRNKLFIFRNISKISSVQKIAPFSNCGADSVST